MISYYFVIFLTLLIFLNIVLVNWSKKNIVLVRVLLVLFFNQYHKQAHMTHLHISLLYTSDKVIW